MTKHNRIKSNYRRLKIGTTSNIHSELSKHNGAHKKFAANIADLHEIPHNIPILNMLLIELNMTLQIHFKEKPISNYNIQWDYKKSTNYWKGSEINKSTTEPSTF